MTTDPSRPLHPNLARIAAEYDAVHEQFRNGRIDAAAARAAMARLTARDDQGVLWSIDPTTARWQYRTHDGNLVDGEPPTYGYATPTAHEVTRHPTVPNAANRVVSEVVDESRMPPDTLVGSTRRTAPEPAVLPLRRLAIAAAVLAAVLLAWWNWPASDEAPPPADPVPVTSTP